MTKIGGFGDASKYLKREATPPGGGSGRIGRFGSEEGSNREGDQE